MKKLFLAVAIVALVSDRASAVLIVNDNFDGYANQAAFEAVWTAIGTTTDVTKKSAQLSTGQSVSAPNAVFVPVSTTATSTSTEFRNRDTFTDTPILAIGTKVVWSFNFFDSPAAAGTTSNPQRNYANLQDTTAPGGTNQLISMGLNNNQLNSVSGGAFYMARILGFSPPTTDPDGGPTEGGTLGAGAYFKLNDFGAGARSQGWHNLKVEISTNDGLSTDYSFYVDNVLAERVNNVGTTASIRQYDNIVIGSGFTNGGINAYFDNMQLEFVPVPEAGAFIAMSMVGLISAGAVWIRKRRVGQPTA
jgi:hypothetical protein